MRATQERREGELQGKIGNLEIEIEQICTANRKQQVERAAQVAAAQQQLNELAVETASAMQQELEEQATIIAELKRQLVDSNSLTMEEHPQLHTAPGKAEREEAQAAEEAAAAARLAAAEAAADADGAAEEANAPTTLWPEQQAMEASITELENKLASSEAEKVEMTRQTMEAEAAQGTTVQVLLDEMTLDKVQLEGENADLRQRLASTEEELAVAKVSASRDKDGITEELGKKMTALEASFCGSEAEVQRLKMLLEDTELAHTDAIRALKEDAVILGTLLCNAMPTQESPRGEQLHGDVTVQKAEEVAELVRHEVKLAHA